MSPMHSCQSCALRCTPVFAPFSAEELAFMIDFRDGEVQLLPGEILFEEHESLSHFYTALSGQGGRYKLLENGERQMVNFVFPGDVAGLSGTLTGEAGASMQAASAMRLCRFSKSRLPELFRNHPERAYALTWIVAAEENFLSEIIATLGQRNALQRTAWALLRIYRRLSALDLRDAEGAVPFPYRQADLADALGLSMVHTNKTLARLRAQVRIVGRRLQVIDEDALAELSLTDPAEPRLRPLL
jgi:CRP/FNR family transcriptional regulator, anaerobic regulatory protein